MKIIHSSYFLALSVLSIGVAAHGQATRTWVSGTGDDANPCSRTAACKTFAGAISKTAAGGVINVTDPGGFGAVTITKSITIDGGGGQTAGVLVSGTNGIVVEGPGSIVTIRNLRFDGLAASGAGAGLNGIEVLAASAVHIENCVISGFGQNGIDVNIASGSQLTVDNTTSQDNTGDGISVVGSTGGTAGQVHVSISNSHFLNNVIGVSGGDSSAITVRASDATGNTGAGFQLEANTYSATMSIADSTSSNNVGAGISAGDGAATSTVRVSNNSIFANGSGYHTGTKGSIISFGNNANTGSGAPTSTTKLD